MTNKTLIIDGNNLIHRAYHKFKSMRNDKGQNTSAIFGFPYLLCALIKLHKPTNVIVAFDGGRDKRRMEVLPTYKQRKSKSDFDYEDFIRQKETVKEILGYLGIPYSSRKDLEADDIIHLYSRKYSRKGLVLIVSTDKDFVQLINPKISLWNAWKDERITHKNYHKYYKFSPEQCVDYLALDGDTSDCIPGYKGMGEKTITQFLNEFSSIESFLASDNNFKKVNKEILEKIYNTNKELIDIKYFCRKHGIKLKDIPITKASKVNTKELNFIAAQHSITTFNKPEFINPFKELSRYVRKRNN